MRRIRSGNERKQREAGEGKDVKEVGGSRKREGSGGECGYEICCLVLIVNSQRERSSHVDRCRRPLHDNCINLLELTLTGGKMEVEGMEKKRGKGDKLRARGGRRGKGGKI